MKSHTLLLVLALTLGGCYIGQGTENLELANQPRGANVQLQIRGGPVNGELLEVQDTALVVLTKQGQVTLVPYRAIQRGEVEMLRELTHGGRQPSMAQRERLRLISRFPRGLKPETRRALLAAYGQTEIQVVGQ
jgi:hypothetical protein